MECASLLIGASGHRGMTVSLRAARDLWPTAEHMRIVEERKKSQGHCNTCARPSVLHHCSSIISLSSINPSNIDE
jgi:hypothetical protein